MADDDKLITVMQTGFDTLADLIGETNARLDATNEAVRHNGRRIDALTEEVRQNGRRIEENGARIDRNSALIARNGELIAKNGARIDSLIEIAGRETRSLRKDVDSLMERVDALEQKAS